MGDHHHIWGLWLSACLDSHAVKLIFIYNCPKSFEPIVSCHSLVSQKLLSSFVFHYSHTFLCLLEKFWANSSLNLFLQKRTTWTDWLFMFCFERISPLEGTGYQPLRKRRRVQYYFIYCDTNRCAVPLCKTISQESKWGRLPYIYSVTVTLKAGLFQVMFCHVKHPFYFLKIEMNPYNLYEDIFL